MSTIQPTLCDFRPEFTISEDIADFVKEHVEARNQLHEHHTSTNTWGVEYEETDEIGVLGEATFGDYYSLSMDTDLRPEGDDGIDFAVNWGGEDVTIDVKSTKYLTDPHLLVRAEKEHVADRFVLVGVDYPDAVLFGWLPRETVTNYEPTESRYGHLNYRVHNSDLRPMPHPDTITSQETV